MEIIMLSDYVIATLALIWITAAVITDLKKREVPNWLSFSLIAMALGIRALASIFSWQATYFLYGLVGLALLFAISNVFYYTRMLGGGDAKLLMALGVAFGTTPSFTPTGILGLPFILVFLLNILLFGSLYGIIYSIVLAIQKRKDFIKEFKRIAKGTERIRILFLMFMAIFLLAVYLLKFFSLLPLVFILIFFPYLYVFVKAVEDSCMLKLLPAEKLTEGDWLAEEVKIGKKIIKITAEGLTKEEIQLIKKAKKKVLIKQGIPFVPVFLLAALASIFIGNIFVMLAELLV